MSTPAPHRRHRAGPAPSPGHQRPTGPAPEPSAEARNDAGRQFLAEALRGAPDLRRYALDHVHDLQIRADIDTARVRLQGGRALLEISPRFVATMLPEPADKRFVLMHEISHLERGDLVREGRFYRRYPRMVNFAMDLFVNGGVLGSRYFEGQSPKVLDRCYDPRSLPWCLLQPPWRLLEAWTGELPEAADHLGTARYVVQHRAVRWDDEQSGPPRPVLDRLVSLTAEVLAKAGFRLAGEAARLYLGGWTGTLPFNGFLHRFHRLLVAEDLLEQVEGRPLLFEHDLEALAQAAGHSGGLPGLGRGLRQRAVPPEEALVRSQAQRVFFHALRAALVSDPAHPTLRRDADVTFPSVLLHMGRREASLLAAGVFPVLFHAPGQALGLTDERVHLYLDVSGSMDEVLAFVTGLTLTAGPLVGTPVYQFSNQVVAVTWEQLQQGVVATTGGTDLDCVARHAQRHGHRRILIVTDGMVRLEEESHRILRRDLETFVVLVNQDNDIPFGMDTDTHTYARQCFTMPAV